MRNGHKKITCKVRFYNVISVKFCGLLKVLIKYVFAKQVGHAYSSCIIQIRINTDCFQMAHSADSDTSPSDI